MNKKKTSIILTLLVFALILLSCEKEKAVFFPPELGDLKVTKITDSSLNVECSILETGGLDIIERGFCWFPKNDSSQICYKKLTGKDSFSAILSGLDIVSYYIRGYAKNISGITYSKTLVINGHKCVDLGLPSGALWAECNIGANNQDDFGNYYAWGETTPKTTYNWSTYSLCNGSSSTITKYCYSGFIDSLTTLESVDDVAATNWGSVWRMPTKEEFEELKNNCTATWTTQNGVNGRLFTGKNGNTIFFPAAGYYKNNSLLGEEGRYWSSSLYTESSQSAEYMYFDSNSCDMEFFYRCRGYSVRAVCK